MNRRGKKKKLSQVLARFDEAPRHPRLNFFSTRGHHGLHSAFSLIESIIVSRCSGTLYEGGNSAFSMASPLLLILQYRSLFSPTAMFAWDLSLSCIAVGKTECSGGSSRCSVAKVEPVPWVAVFFLPMDVE